MKQEVGIVALSAILPVILLAGLLRGVEEISAKIVALLLPAAISGGMALLMMAVIRGRQS